MKLADSVTDLFGTIKPTSLPDALTGDPTTGLGKLFSVSLKITIIAGGIILLIYLLWGGFDYLTSEGDKEKLNNARHKIQYAIVGFFILFAALTIFTVVTSNILGNKMIEKTPQGWKFNIPSL